jgi:hypothetical protein
VSFASVIFLAGRGHWVGPTLLQKRPTECGVSECDHEAETLGDPGPLIAVGPRKINNRKNPPF